MLFSLVGLSDMVFFIGELSVRIGPCDMVFSIIGDFGMVFSIVGLSVTDSPSWTPPLWMIFALAGSSGRLSPSKFGLCRLPQAMYVCFGLLLARSCRARTIDLQCQSLSLRRALLLHTRLRQARTIDRQCQSLSLRRAFLLRSVCLSLHLTVKSFAVRWPTRSQN